MDIPFKKDPKEYTQGFPSSWNIFDLLPKDHICFVFEEIFKQINVSNLMKDYSREGQNAFHPRLIVSILIYAYSNGIFSSRQIQQKCKEDIGFMYIAHMQCPDFRVLSDFRKNNYKFFKECFTQSVALAVKAGLASLGHISLDGSKFKANTSKHKAMSYGRLKKQEKKLTTEIENLIQKAKQCDQEEDEEYKDKTGYEIPEDLKYKESRLKKIKEAKEALEKRENELNPKKTIDDKKQISFADHEARIMGKKGHFNYSYNSQISVDQDNQIIVGQHVSQNATDKQEVKPALDEIQQTTGQTPEKMSLDNGYFSGNNLETLEEAAIDAYVAVGKGEQTAPGDIDDCNRKIKKSDFTYDQSSDCFICPEGQQLLLRSNGKDGTKVYRASHDSCSTCKRHNQCCQSKKSEPRSIQSDDKEHLRQSMVDKMQEESSKEIYSKRKTIVEPVFGQIKNTGFREFSLRGLKKVAGEFSLMCVSHNIKKIVRAIQTGTVWFKEGQLAYARA